MQELSWHASSWMSQQAVCRVHLQGMCSSMKGAVMLAMQCLWWALAEKIELGAMKGRACAHPVPVQLST